MKTATACLTRHSAHMRLLSKCEDKLSFLVNSVASKASLEDSGRIHENTGYS